MIKTESTRANEIVLDRTYQWAVVFFSLSAAAMAAIAVVLPSGYSVGALLLLIGSVTLLSREGLPKMDGLAWLTAAAMAAYSVYWMASAAIRSEGAAALDQPSRLLLAVPVLLAVSKTGLRWSLIWPGIAVGGVATGLIGLQETLIGGASRASGFVGPEHFGNLSALFASLSLVGLAWSINVGQKSAYRVIPLLGIVGGLGGAASSGTVASSLALLISLIVIALSLIRLRMPVIGVSAMIVLFVAGAAIYSQDNLSLKSRTATYIERIEAFSDGGSATSSRPIRFDVWKGATQLFWEKPWFGWGNEGYQARMHALAENGYITARAADFNHAHNDWFNVLSKQGTIGFVILLAVYFFPIFFFVKRVSSLGVDSSGFISLGGLVLCVSFFTYGLTHHALGSNNGIMNYAFWLAIFCGSLAARKQGSDDRTAPN